MSVAVPTLALVGTYTAYGLQQQHQPDPLGSTVASYSMRALETGVRQTDAGGALPLTSSSPSASRRRSSTPKRAASPAPSSSATPAPSSPPSSPPPTCSGTGGVAGTGMLPLNYATIVNFLVANGYSPTGAVGIAGNIYQESGGNPESVGTGGGGLIGWTPLPAGFVTGNAAADLQTQLSALLSYNQQWAEYIPALNAATSPTEAADIYMNDFERPGDPDAANREGAAVAVAQACGIGS
jgi:Phage tail lysozyme